MRLPCRLMSGHVLLTILLQASTDPPSKVQPKRGFARSSVESVKSRTGP